MPNHDYITVNVSGSHTGAATVRLTDTDSAVTAVGIGLAFTTNMLCAPTNEGSASTTLATSFT